MSAQRSTVFNEVSATLHARGEQYGPAWLTTGVLMDALPAHQLTNLVAVRKMFPWVMILNKLVRILKTPNDPDHWRDIAGYAELVLTHLMEQEEDFDALSDK